jgi:phosphoglycolate phosphatase
LSKKNYTPRTDYDFCSIIGDGAKNMVRVAIEKIDLTSKERELETIDILDEFLNLYLKNTYKYSEVYPKVNEVIDYLHDNKIQWGIVTNKAKKFTDNILKHPPFNKAQCCICPDDVVNKKPDPEGILLACDILKVNPKNTWYVGDHIRDMEAGISAGCKVAYASYGYVEIEKDKEALKKIGCKILKSISQITTLI